MGGTWSVSQEQGKENERKGIELFVKKLKDGPDLRVDKSLVMFTGLASLDSLRQHYENRKMEAGDCAADWIKNLVEKLGAFASSPEVVGLGALAIAVLIDIISFSRPGESVKDALRCVFAEEKASDVRDLIDECLKRCTMHIGNQDKLRSDLEQIECQLSVALTKLKNSMVMDGHVSNQALKVWVNGAAFHVQVLIHLVRLGGTQTCKPIETLLSVYQRDLDSLFEKHSELIKGKCSIISKSRPFGFYCLLLMDEDSNVHYMDPFVSYEKYLEAYYDHRYGRQKCDMQKHFRDVGQNLQELLLQRGSFRVD